MKVHALTIPDENGDFTIIVNDNLDDGVMRQALDHELKHVMLNHFYDCRNVAIDEKEANIRGCKNVKNSNICAI